MRTVNLVLSRSSAIMYNENISPSFKIKCADNVLIDFQLHVHKQGCLN